MVLTFNLTISMFKSLPNKEVLDMSKMNTLADNKFNGAKMMISVFDRVENMVGKGENADYQHFLLFPQCFPKPSFLRFIKSLDCVIKG